VQLAACGPLSVGDQALSERGDTIADMIARPGAARCMPGKLDRPSVSAAEHGHRVLVAGAHRR